MQCKDIPDIPILEFLRLRYPEWSTHGQFHGMHTVQDAIPEGTPFKLQLAKMRQLLKRGFVDGCGCGCRGDWVLKPKGKEFLQKQLTDSKPTTNGER